MWCGDWTGWVVCESVYSSSSWTLGRSRKEKEGKGRSGEMREEGEDNYAFVMLVPSVSSNFLSASLPLALS